MKYDANKIHFNQRSRRHAGIDHAEMTLTNNKGTYFENVTEMNEIWEEVNPKRAISRE